MKAIFLMLVFIILWSTVAPAEELSPEKKLEAIQKQLKESKKKLYETKAEQQAVLGKLAVIRKELKQTTQTLNRAQSKIKANESQSIVLGSEIMERAKVLQSREQKLTKRVREIYKASGLNYPELLIASHSMADFFNRLYFFSKIINQDASLVLGVREDVQFVQRKKKILEGKTQEIRQLAKIVAEKKEEYVVKEEEKKSLYKSLEERKTEYEAQIVELEKSSFEMEKLILQSAASRKGGGALGSGNFAWPLRGRLTSTYGYRRHPLWGGRNLHTGIDIANSYGTPVKAADGGEVIFAGWWDGYGKAVAIDHGKGLSTIYAHLSKIYANVGLAVAKGQTIGLVGSTGYSTGPHLHFEIRKNGKPVNPMGFLK